MTIIAELKFEHVESGVKYHNPNLWYLQTLHIHNTQQICFQLFVTRGILLIIKSENNTKIENIVTEDMKYHEMAVFRILLQLLGNPTT